MNYFLWFFRRCVVLVFLLAFFVTIFLSLPLISTGYAQSITPVLLTDDVALGGQLVVRGYNFVAGETYVIQSQIGVNLVSLGRVTAARGGIIAPTSLTLPRSTLPGGYTLEARELGGNLVATTTFTVRAAPTIQLNPTTGPPGTLVQVTVNNLTPGTLQVDFHDATVIGPLTSLKTNYSGRFIIPRGARFPSDGIITINVLNQVGRRIVGGGTTTFTLEAAQPPPVYSITNVTLSTANLRAGDEFTINGQISPSPGDAASEIQLHSYWRQEDRRANSSARQPALSQRDYINVPINLGLANIAPDGTFQILAQSPSLLKGDPISGRAGDEIELMLVAQDQVATTTHKTVAGKLKPFRVQILTDQGGKIPYIPVDSNKVPIDVSMEFGGVFSVTVMSDTFDLTNAQAILTAEQQAALQDKLEQEALNYLQCHGLFEEQQTGLIKWWEWQMNPDELITQGLNPAIELPPGHVPIQGVQTAAKNRPDNRSAGLIPDGEMRLEIYTVDVDATNALSGSQEGYGFVDENKAHRPFKEIYFYNRADEIAFILKPVQDANDKIHYLAELTAHPVEIRLPPLPSDWHSGMYIAGIWVEDRPLPNNYLPGLAGLSGQSLNSAPFEFGDFFSLVNAPSGHFNYNGQEPLDIKVHLKGLDSQSSPNVTILVDGKSYPTVVAAPTANESLQQNRCQTGTVKQDDSLVVTAEIPDAYQLPLGSRIFEVRASDGQNTNLVEENRIHFITYSADFDHPNFSNRQLAYKPRQLTLNAISLPGNNTDIGADVPQVGQQDSDVVVNSAVTRRNWTHVGSKGADVGPAFESGGMDSDALNNPAQPQNFGSGGTGNSGNRLSITRLKAAPQTLDKVTILDTGKIRIFEYGYGIPEIAYVYIAVDFQVVATAIINPTIHSGVAVIFDTEVGVFVTIGAEVLAGIGEVKITINANIGVQIPVEFTWEATIDTDNCFYYGMFYTYIAQLLWGLVDVAEGSGTIFDDETGNCVTLRPAHTQTETPAPESSNPALATDGLGTILAVWRSKEGHIMSSRLEGQTWATPLPIVENGKSGDPDIAFYAPGQAIAVWSQSGLTAPPAADSSIPDVLRHQHLAYAVYNSLTGWSAPQNLTQPTTGDGHAALAGCMSTNPDCPAGGAVTAVWVHDDAGDVGQQQFRIHTGLYQNSSWTLGEVDSANTGFSDTQPEVAYVAGTPLVAWVRDEDRDLLTLDDHKLTTRFLDGVSSVQTPINHPGGANRASLIADGETVHLVFTVSDEGDGLVSNRRSLYRALAACNNRVCSWSSGQMKDAYGRAIFAESPTLTQNSRGKPTLTFRAMGFGESAVPEGPLSAIPDPIGALAHTGEMAQINLESNFATQIGQVSYLSGDGAVYWQPDAVFDSINDSTIVMAVTGAPPDVERNPAYRLAAEIEQQTAVVTPDESLVFASVTNLPNFTLTGVEADSAYLHQSRTPQVTINLYNSGLQWTAPPTQSLEIVATWNGGPGVGQSAGETTVTTLAAGEHITPTLALTLPTGLLEMEHALFLTVNPFQDIAEQTSADNQLVLNLGGLPVPNGLQAQTQAGIPGVNLYWSAESDPRVVGYRIYRVNEVGEQVAVGSSLSETWTDIDVNLDQTYWYAVAAFTNNQTESAPSNVISATTQSRSGTIGPFVYLPVVFR